MVPCFMDITEFGPRKRKKPPRQVSPTRRLIGSRRNSDANSPAIFLTGSRSQSLDRVLDRGQIIEHIPVGGWLDGGGSGKNGGLAGWLLASRLLLVSRLLLALIRA